MIKGWKKLTTMPLTILISNVCIRQKERGWEFTNLKMKIKIKNLRKNKNEISLEQKL